MPYIGRDAQTAQSQNKIIDDISSSFNGSTTSFALLVGGVAPAPFPVTSQNLLISVGGVIQEPDGTGTNGYQLTGANIVFSAAPASGQSFFGVILAGADYVNAGANFPDGDAGTPSITFSQDLDTGLFRSGTGTTSFTSNNNRIADFGTTEIVFNEDGDDINFRVEGDVESDLLFVDAGNDRVGIGTSSPSFKLDVEGGSTTVARLSCTAVGTYTTNLKFKTFGGSDSNSIGFDTSDDFKVVADGTEVIHAGSNGRVGIGVSSPDSKVHIVDALSGGQLLVATNDTDSTEKYGSLGTVHYTNSEQPALGVATQSNSSYNNILIGGGLGEFNAATHIKFFTASNNTTTTGTEHLRITPDGHVLYNQFSSATPGYGNTTTGGAFEHVSSGIGVFLSRSDACPLFTNRNTNGSVIEFRRSGTLEGYINVTTSAASLVSTSDYRLKENAVSIADGITRVKQLQPKRFNFIADPSTTVDGFMAHEVQTVVPEAAFGEHDAVDAEGNPEYQGLDQSKLVPLLTAALQEAIAKIETLETKVAALEEAS